MSTSSRTATATRPRRVSPRDPRLGAWQDFLTAHALLMGRLEEELADAMGMSLGEYSTLVQLVQAPGRRKRMSDLADGAFLTRGGVTRLIDRLEQDGLVERDRCVSDGRGTEAVLTEAGVDRLRAASRIHLRGVDEYYLSRVSDQDQETVGRVMRDVAEGIRAAR